MKNLLFPTLSVITIIATLQPVQAQTYIQTTTTDSHSSLVLQYSSGYPNSSSVYVSPSYVAPAQVTPPVNIYNQQIYINNPYVVNTPPFTNHSQQNQQAVQANPTYLNALYPANANYANSNCWNCVPSQNLHLQQNQQAVQVNPTYLNSLYPANPNSANYNCWNCLPYGNVTLQQNQVININPTYLQPIHKSPHRIYR